jgi:putative thiamine transport system ATP-binding protein
MSALVLDKVQITPAGQTAALFAPLTLCVRAGDVVTLMGPSGIGKSTLMDYVGGHLSGGFKATGTVTLNGRDLTGLAAERREIGILFQDATLFPHLSVGDNLAFGLTRHIKGRTARQIAVSDALEQAGLAGFEQRDPAELSGGQRARVALMRTLLARPKALLLDEPFSKLDPDLRAEVRAFVFAHIRDRAIPVIMVTHDASDAAAAAGPVVRL